jgi:hypothetical protein
MTREPLSGRKFVALSLLRVWILAAVCFSAPARGQELDAAYNYLQGKWSAECRQFARIKRRMISLTGKRRTDGSTKRVQMRFSHGPTNGVGRLSKNCAIVVRSRSHFGTSARQFN